MTIQEIRLLMLIGKVESQISTRNQFPLSQKPKISLNKSNLWSTYSYREDESDGDLKIQMRLDLSDMDENEEEGKHEQSHEEEPSNRIILNFNDIDEEDQVDEAKGKS